MKEFYITGIDSKQNRGFGRGSSSLEINEWLQKQNRYCIYIHNSSFDVLEFRVNTFDIRNSFHSDSIPSINCSLLALCLVL
jgi:hypothetical protein